MIGVATSADLEAIVTLERQGFDEATRWSADAWRAEIDASDRYVVVFRSGALLDGVATFSHASETADLLRVVVRPETRRRGIASDLVQAGRGWAAGMGAERLLLEVEADNGPALWLYVKLGFEPVAERRDYYGPGRHAVVMEVRL
jgi:[ribosomal protein S18]-alanine N-acetyltransferase